MEHQYVFLFWWYGLYTIIKSSRKGYRYTIIHIKWIKRVTWIFTSLSYIKGSSYNHTANTRYGTASPAPWPFPTWTQVNGSRPWRCRYHSFVSRRHWEDLRLSCGNFSFLMKCNEFVQRIQKWGAEQYESSSKAEMAYILKGRKGVLKLTSSICSRYWLRNLTPL